jgi:hypothetical protein
MARTPILTPTRLVASGSNFALSMALIELQREALAAAAMMPKPIVITAAASSEYRLERSE